MYEDTGGSLRHICTGMGFFGSVVHSSLSYSQDIIHQMYKYCSHIEILGDLMQSLRFILSRLQPTIIVFLTNVALF